MERGGVHEITYTTSRLVSVSEVTASLAANEELLRDAVGLLRQIYPDLTVESMSIGFRSASSASPLKEILAYAIFLAYQDDLKKEIPGLIKELTGYEVPKNMETVVTVLVMVVAIYGISAAYERFKGKKDEKLPPSIEGNYNQIIQISGDLIGVAPDEVETALKKQFQPKGRLNALAKRAVHFIRPAKAEDGAGVKGGGVELTPETIRDAPSITDIALEEDVEHQDPYPDEPIVIHAMDLDRTNLGWAAHVPSISSKRLQMQLYPGVDPNSLFGKREVRADIIVVSRRMDGGEFVPYRILFQKLTSE